MKSDPNNSPAPSPWKPLFLCLAWVGALFACAFAWLPVTIPLGHTIIEDMFYYLQGAANLVEGKPASLDGIHPTNGFHPLWMLICTAIVGTCGTETERAIQVALFCASLCFVATAWVLFRALRRSPAPSVALPFAAYFLFNYRMMSVPLGGLETGLAGLSVALITAFLLQRESLKSLTDSLLLGVLLGFAFNARMDSLLLGGVVWLYLTARGWGAYREESGLPRALKSLFLPSMAGAVALLMLIPWFLFSWRTSGTLLPNSRVAIKIWSGGAWDPASGVLSNLEAFLANRASRLIEPINDLGNMFGYWPIAAPSVSPLRYVGVLLFGVSILVFLALLWKARRDPVLRVLWWIPLYTLSHAVYYILFGRVGIRYLYPAMLPFLVFVAWVVAGLAACSRDPGRACQRVAGCFVFLIMGAMLAGGDAFRRGYASDRWHPLHSALYEEIAPWIEDNTPQDSVVGGFNSGILSYRCGRPVVNLDGVMNDSVIPALKEKRLCRYIDEQGVRYLADLESEIEKFMNGFCGDPNWKDRWRRVHEREEGYGGGVGTKRLVVLERLPESPGSPNDPIRGVTANGE